MKALEHPVLADQNIHPSVVEGLRVRAVDVVTLSEAGIDASAPDVEILEACRATGRVVLTHDGDFGTLAVQQGVPVFGIVYLRPGHISPEFVLEMIDVLGRMEAEAAPPFIAVVVRRAGSVRVRLRAL
jgi:predicted nuclease of predicted toxin-antitoxin system